MTATDLGTLPGRLVHVRTLSGLSTRELGDLAGVACGTITLIETGKRGKRPNAETIARLAKPMGTTSEWLLRGEGREPTARRVKAAVKRAQAGEKPTVRPRLWKPKPRHQAQHSAFN
jgi:transcriptional regulator with XRE-family HTH domain